MKEEAYRAMLERMESDITPIIQGAALASIAISLKRIADILTATSIRIPGFTELPPQSQKQLRALAADNYAGDLTCPVCGNKYRDHNAFSSNPCQPCA